MARAQVRSSPLVGLTAGALAALIIEDLGLTSTVSFWGDPGPLIVGCALLAALLWTTRLKRLAALAVVALSILWLLVAFTPLSATPVAASVTAPVMRPRRPPAGGSDVSAIGATSIDPVVAA